MSQKALKVLLVATVAALFLYLATQATTITSKGSFIFVGILVILLGLYDYFSNDGNKQQIFKGSALIFLSGALLFAVVLAGAVPLILVPLITFYVGVKKIVLAYM